MPLRGRNKGGVWIKKMKNGNNIAAKYSKEMDKVKNYTFCDLLNRFKVY